jgi:hypothetical protein
MRFIDLHKITADRAARDMYNDNEEGEGPTGTIASTPVQVQVEAIRCFYPRKDNRPGTRLTFTDGGGFAVVEAFDVVRGMVSPQ